MPDMTEDAEVLPMDIDGEGEPMEIEDGVEAMEVDPQQRVPQHRPETEVMEEPVEGEGALQRHGQITEDEIKSLQGLLELEGNPTLDTDLTEQIMLRGWLNKNVNEFVKAYRADPRLGEVMVALEPGPKSPKQLADEARWSAIYQYEHGFLWFKNSEGGRLLVMPEGDYAKHLREAVMVIFHAAFKSGHPGREKLRLDISRIFVWRNLLKDIKEFVKTCDVCQHVKGTPSRGVYLQPLPIPSGRLHRLHMDFVTGLPTSKEGYSQIMTIIDSFSSFAVFIPLKDTAKTPEVADAFLRHWVAVAGVPAQIVTDRDTKFTADDWQQFARAIGSEHSFTTSGRAQANGKVERAQKTVATFLRAHLVFKKETWSDILPLIQLSYNTTLQSASGATPYECLFGFSCLKPQHAALGVIPQDSTRAQETHQRWLHQQLMEEDIRQSLSMAQHRMVEVQNPRYDNRSFEKGERVLVSTKILTPPGERLSHGFKFMPKWAGPYKITGVNTAAHTVTLDFAEDRDVIRVHPNINTCWIKKYASQDQGHPVVQPGSKRYLRDKHVNPTQLKAIKDHLCYGLDASTYRFQCTWLDEYQGVFRSTWEPLKNFVSDDGQRVDVPVLEDYLKKVKLWRKVQQALMRAGKLHRRQVSKKRVRAGAALKKQDVAAGIAPSRAPTQRQRQPPTRLVEQ